MSYEKLIEIRKESVSGESDWTWIKSDKGAFEGPKKDWEEHNAVKYFKYLKKKEVCVTAGGNCGMYARLYSKIFDCVIAFEPDPLNFHCLVNNTQTDNVVKIQAALGEKASFGNIVRKSMTNVGMHRMEGTEGIIPIMTIDSFNFPDIDLLQLDVEGFEQRVIEGAVETLKRCNPVIVVERNNSEKFLQSLGYRFVEQSGHADRIYIRS